MRLTRLAAAFLLTAAVGAPAVAQNSSSEPPPIVNAPPPKADPAPTGAPPAVTEIPVETNATAPAETVVRVETPSIEPVTIDPDAAYPNGFADPADPFGNDLSLARRDSGGFPWGLLGLLGLLGLIPLFRRTGRTTRTVYVDRDAPGRILREEQTEE